MLYYRKQLFHATLSLCLCYHFVIYFWCSTEQRPSFASADIVLLLCTGNVINGSQLVSSTPGAVVSDAVFQLPPYHEHRLVVRRNDAPCHPQNR